MPEVKTNPHFLTPSPINPDLPLFVFLPGMDGTGQLWRSNQRLESAFDIRCLAIPPEHLTGWDVLCDQVLELITVELESQPYRSVYICGESFGGCLAIKMALRSQKMFNRIILANPASSFPQQWHLNWGSQFLKYLPDVIYRLGAVCLLPFLAALERIHPRHRPAILKAMQSLPAETILWRLSLLMDFDVEERQLTKIQQPTLLIASRADRMLPSVDEAKRLIRYLPNAQMLVLPASGHACLIEADIDLYKILKQQNFLALLN